MADSPIIKPGQGLGEAPEDGNTYGREDGEWVIVEGFPEAPLDGQQYARQSLDGIEGTWTPVDSTGAYPPLPPSDGIEYIIVDGEWVPLTHDGGVYTGSGVPQGGIIDPSGDSVIPATLALVGVWSPGDLVVVDVNVDTVPNTVSLSVTIEQNALEVAQALAGNISLIANCMAVENDGVVFVRADGGGTTVALDNLVVTPVAGVDRSVPIQEGDLMQQARTHLTGVAPSPNSMQPGQLIANPTDAMLWVGDYIGNPIPIQGEPFPEAPIDGTPYSRQDAGWVPASTGGGGEANTSSNAGAGAGLAMAKAGVDLPFKTLVEGTNVTFTIGTDTITINAAGGSGGGEANTASTPNATAEELTMPKVGVDLQFKGLVAGTGVVLTDDGDAITIDATGTGGGEANTSSNLGLGEQVAAPKNGVDLPFKTLIAGTNVTLTATTNDITIDAAGGGGSNPPITPTPPTDPDDGDMYFDPSDNNLYIWDGTTWVKVSQDFLRDLQDTAVDAPPAMNDILTWDGANWINIQFKDHPSYQEPIAPAIEVPVNKPAHGFVVTQCVRWNGTAWILAMLDVATNVSHGVVTEVIDADNFKVAMVGRYEIAGHGLALNEWLYVSDTVPGELASVPPDLEQPIVFVESATHIWVYPYRPNNTGGAAIAGMQIEMSRLANRIRNLESK